MKRLKLGVIGAGLIWRNVHERILRQLEEQVELAAFSAVSEETVRRLRDEYSHVPCYTNYLELLDVKEIDAVVILTPLNLNGKIAQEALMKGKHVLVEKPLALSIAEVGRIIELEKAYSRHVLVLEQVRYLSSLERLKTLLDSGRIGSVVSFECVEHFKLDAERNDHGGYGRTNWRIQADFPLGNLFDGGIHTVSNLTYLFGLPDSVYANGIKWREGFGAYDLVKMMMTYPSGLTGILSHSSYLDSGTNYFHIRGTEGTIEVSHSSIQIKGEVAEETPIESQDAHYSMWTSCLEQLAGNHPIRYGSHEAMCDIAVLEAADRSLQTKLPYAIRLTE